MVFSGASPKARALDLIALLRKIVRWTCGLLTLGSAERNPLADLLTRALCPFRKPTESDHASAVCDGPCLTKRQFGPGTYDMLSWPVSCPEELSLQAEPHASIASC